MPVYTPPPGGAVDLVFRRPLDTAHPVDLVFGPEEVAVGGDAVGAGWVSLPGLLSVTATGAYDNAVQRGLRAGASTGWGRATPLRAAVVVPMRQGGRIVAQSAERWAPGVPLRAHVLAGWSKLDLLAVLAGMAWDAGTGQRVEAGTRWQEMTRRRVSASPQWERASPERLQVLSPWQQMTPRRGALAAAWSPATPQRRQWRAPWQVGQAVRAGGAVPWERARRPQPGPYVPPIDPNPPVVRCYTPPRGDAVELVLADRWFGPSAVLKFRCRDFSLPAQFVVPYRKIYVALHTLSAVRLPDLTPITLQSCTLSTDADSFCWTLSGVGDASLMTLLAADENGPAQIRLMVDGLPWAFVVERLGRTRQFGQTRTQISGRSLPALLGAPYMPAQSWSNAAAVTAAQLIAQALDLTGITADTSLIDDWLIPAGAWSHSGTPLSAVQRVAESIGAIVASDRLNPMLRLLPRYPLMPWEWGGSAVAPDVQMPLASVVRDSIESRDAPAYDRVIVSGESQGVLGVVTRTGFGGTLPAQMVTDPLMTAQAAVVQRGRAVLGAGGRQSLITQELPILTGGQLPGVLDVNHLVEVVEPGETWRGLVRSVTVTAGYSVVRQSVTLERHHHHN
jgi:hypothetical protein